LAAHGGGVVTKVLPDFAADPFPYLAEVEKAFLIAPERCVKQKGASSRVLEGGIRKYRVCRYGS